MNYFYLSELEKNTIDIKLKNKIEKIVKNKDSAKRNIAYGNYLLSRYTKNTKNYKKEFDFLIKGHQAFFEWFWCLIFPFFFSKIPISKTCARCRVVSSLFSRPKDDLTKSLVLFSLSPSQRVQSPSGKRPSDQRNVVKTPTTDDDQIRLEDDVVSFSSHHKIWTDRFATKKF